MLQIFHIIVVVVVLLLLNFAWVFFSCFCILDRDATLESVLNILICGVNRSDSCLFHFPEISFRKEWIIYDNKGVRRERTRDPRALEVTGSDNRGRGWMDENSALCIYNANDVIVRG